MAVDMKLMLILAVASTCFSEVKSSIEECVNCSGCSCGGVECFEFDPSGDNGPPNGEACERGGCIDCSVIVYGNWAEWELSTDCSKTCGSGTQERTRTCSDPSPENGGSNCTSLDEISGIGAEQVETDIVTCNDFPCPKDPKGPKGCWNLVSKRKCRAKLLAGKCGKPYWKTRCCKTCRGGCANIWSNKRCRKLIPHCKRSSMVKKKCRKACKKC